MGLFDFFKKKDKEEPKTSSFNMSIRYEYTWKDEVPESERDFKLQKCYKDSCCEFCQYLVNSNKYYSRADIQQISEHLGYNVFNRGGGVVDENEKPICACHFKSVIVTKKEKGA